MAEKLSLIEKVDPAHTALLVIDIQNDFCSPDGLLGRRGRNLSMIERSINRLIPTINTARSAGVVTLYTQQIYDRSKLNDLQIEQYDLDGKFVTCDIEGNGHQFYRIDPPRSDVYKKYNYNVFSNPALVERLESNNVKTLVIAGVDTHYCVETAIRNGFDLGYTIVVPADLIATGAENLDMHERTIELVRRTYGVLTTSSDLIDAWSGSSIKDVSASRSNLGLVEKFRATAELVDAGAAIKKASLARDNPYASDAEIETMLMQWLRDRPADSPGRHRKSA